MQENKENAFPKTQMSSITSFDLHAVTEAKYTMLARIQQECTAHITKSKKNCYESDINFAETFFFFYFYFILFFNGENPNCWVI